MKRIHRTYSIDLDIADHSKANLEITNMSDWINETYRKQFMNLEAKTKELADLNKRQEQLISEIKALKSLDEKAFDLTEPEFKFLKFEAPRRLKAGASFEGVYNYYKNAVAKCPVTRRQFKILMERVKG